MRTRWLKGFAEWTSIINTPAFVLLLLVCNGCVATSAYQSYTPDSKPSVARGVQVEIEVYDQRLEPVSSKPYRLMPEPSVLLRILNDHAEAHFRHSGYDVVEGASRDLKIKGRLIWLDFNPQSTVFVAHMRVHFVITDHGDTIFDDAYTVRKVRQLGTNLVVDMYRDILNQLENDIAAYLKS